MPLSDADSVLKGNRLPMKYSDIRDTAVINKCRGRMRVKMARLARGTRVAIR